MDKIRSQIKEQIIQIADEGINPQNVDYLGKIVDIDKDLVKKCKMEDEIMMNRYRDDYGRDNYGRNYGNNYGDDYREVEGRRYSRRGYDAKYRGADQIDAMNDYYHDYRDSMVYGSNQDTKKSLKYMLESVEDFFEKLMDDANSQEEVEMIRETARKIADK